MGIVRKVMRMSHHWSRKFHRVWMAELRDASGHISRYIPPAVRYLWPKLFNKLVFEIVSLFIFEGALYLSYRIIIHGIYHYILFTLLFVTSIT